MRDFCSDDSFFGGTLQNPFSAKDSGSTSVCTNPEKTWYHEMSVALI